MLALWPLCPPNRAEKYVFEAAGHFGPWNTSCCNNLSLKQPVLCIWGNGLNQNTARQPREKANSDKKKKNWKWTKKPEAPLVYWGRGGGGHPCWGRWLKSHLFHLSLKESTSVDWIYPPEAHALLSRASAGTRGAMAQARSRSLLPRRWLAAGGKRLFNSFSECLVEWVCGAGNHVRNFVTRGVLQSPALGWVQWGDMTG